MPAKRLRMYQIGSLVRRMAKLTDEADYDAGETFENVSSTLGMLGIMTTTMADDFGLGAFYIVALSWES
ncbi:unnamed protein product [Protopolystoma xenopodis]|uniref:Uncharacterized protein n=1 Tax=Protopolystoma xenopodis TaxID=117903 RepID=A0A3S5C513_9PLAT|nr:unnamed protein product [Protopolystoma xenopodis]